MKENRDSEENKEFPKGNPFGVPENYFEESRKSIYDSIVSLPDSEKSAAENPFRVPDGYFESLPGSIANKVTVKRQSSKWQGFLLRPRFAVPIFAVLIILVGLYLRKMKQSEVPMQQEFSLVDLRDSEYLLEIDESLIVEFISSQAKDTTFEGYEQYLLDNNVEISQIENAL